MLLGLLSPVLSSFVSLVVFLQGISGRVGGVPPVNGIGLGMVAMAFILWFFLDGPSY